MKKSLLFLFLLVLGVTQGWAVDYLELPASGNNPGAAANSGNRTLAEGGTYRVETNTTIDGTKNNVYGLRVPENSTVTIYIAKGKTLLVRGKHGSAQNTPGKPAIEVPSTSTLIITGGGTLRVYGGRAFTYAGYVGGSGAAPAIGGIGGNGGANRAIGSDGAAMGNVYIRGNVTVRAARGTSLGRRTTNSHGADGIVPTYAIGGGGGGGAGRNAANGSRFANGSNGNNGNLYIEKSARVLYLNGKRRLSDDKNFKTPTKLNVQYIVDGTLSTTQVLNEYGTLNVKNEAYSVTTEDKTLNEDGFTTVTVKNVKSWNTRADGTGDTYNPKDLLVYNNINRTGASVDFPLYAQWDENSGVQFNGIHDAYELTQFANVVNAGKAKANGILMADINMAESAWTSTTVARDGKEWGDWSPWVPIGICDVPAPSDTDYDRAFLGKFDGNGYIVSNLTMANPATNRTDVTEIWNAAYPRAGLIGYARGATIKNVVVKNAEIYGKWQVAAVCGRLDQYGSKEGSLINCGSFGSLSLNLVGLKGVTNENDMSGNARVVAGVACADFNGDPVHVSSVWSTYSEYTNTTPAAGNNWTPRKNYVVATWNNTRNPYWSDYTQNSGTQNNGRAKKTWVYVSSANSSWLANGKLCLDLNGNVDGATTWTQTFVNGDDNDPCSYNECPRPTNRGLAVYSGTSNYNRIYTISFESNGGTDCDDIYITRKYNVTDSYTYPELPTTTRDGREFVGWFDSNAENANKVTSTSGISSDITLYAQWNQTMTVKVNQDPKEKDYYYCTFYYSDQAYKILTPGALAYTAKREDDVASLTMESVKDVNGNISKIIPAGEAVILRVKVPDVVEGNDVIKLQAVDSDADIDPYNILYGSDEEVLVEDVSDDIPDTSDNAAEDATRTNCYVFSGNATNGIGFYLPKAKYTSGENSGKKYLKAHMAFVLLDGAISLTAASDDANAKTLSMLFEDDEEQTTGISEFKSDETKKAIFSINGMPLSKLQKGINIVGGKKVFVK